MSCRSSAKKDVKHILPVRMGNEHTVGSMNESKFGRFVNIPTNPKEQPAELCKLCKTLETH